MTKDRECLIEYECLVTDMMVALCKIGKSSPENNKAIEKYRKRFDKKSGEIFSKWAFDDEVIDV